MSKSKLRKLDFRSNAVKTMGIRIAVLGGTLMATGPVYYQWHFSKSPGSIASDQWAYSYLLRALALGGLVAILGVAVVSLHKSSIEAAGMSPDESAAKTKSLTFEFARLIVIGCGLHLVLWLPFLVSMPPGSGFRDMGLSLPIIIVSVIGIIGGPLVALTQYMFHRPRIYALVTLLIAPIPPLLFKLTYWYIFSILKLRLLP